MRQSFRKDDIMKIFLIILLILLILIYIWSILDKLYQIVKINSCIDALYNFLQSTSVSNYSNSLIGDNYKTQLNHVLAKYPDICEFISLNSDSLNYGVSDYKNYIASISLYNELLMTRNFLRKNFFKCLNPVNSLKKLISFPSSLFKFWGFKINPFLAKFFNLFGWIITYLLTMYMDEIKALISSISKLR